VTTGKAEIMQFENSLPKIKLGRFYYRFKLNYALNQNFIYFCFLNCLYFVMSLIF
jgi:hypothetical protein